MGKVLRYVACERKPQPGDIALCTKCAAILALTDDLGLRCANAQEFQDLNFDPTIIAAQMTIRAESNWNPLPTSDIGKARRLFRKAGLPFPTIPKQLSGHMKERGTWCFATRELRVSPYNLQHYVEEGRCALGDYAVLCHSGHGVNSYAIQYYLVYGPLRMFLHLGWGGIYMDADAATSKIRDCFSLADEIVPAAASMGKLMAGDRLTIVASDFYGSYWCEPRQNRHQIIQSSNTPAEIMADVLHWLQIRDALSDGRMFP